MYVIVIFLQTSPPLPTTTTSNHQDLLPTSNVLPSTNKSLMSPGMFQQRSHTDPLPPSAAKKDTQPLVAGLTRSQLQQALLHLIQVSTSGGRVHQWYSQVEITPEAR